ncbi:MAG: BatA domain-containing protein [Lentisphaeria bacterium]|nr:BatA domain-containing protein [Lentisphaeria bacterium]
MTFVQLSMLWGLPLALLPVLIHFLNRMRHRSVDWGAMLFLLRARKQSVRFAKLRRFLLLACRVMALALLCIALARPLLRGAAGRLFSGPPDTILVLLDRSASMERRAHDTEHTLREEAVRQLLDRSFLLEQAKRVVVLDSASGELVDVPNPELFRDDSVWPGTATGAEIPVLMETAFGVLEGSRAGRSEIWVVSDLQASTWVPGSEVWRHVAAANARLSQQPTCRILALRSADAANCAVRVHGAALREESGTTELRLSFSVLGDGPASGVLPVSVEIDGRRTALDLHFEGGRLAIERRIALNGEVRTGWGFVELPGDTCAADNRAYFAFEPPLAQRAIVASQHRGEAARMLALAAAPAPDTLSQRVDVISPSSFPATDLGDCALVVWVGASHRHEQRLESFVRGGGSLLLVPDSTAPAPDFAQATWGQAQHAPEAEPFRVERWDAESGLFADTPSGGMLPLDRLVCLRRRVLSAPSDAASAWFHDGAVFAAARRVGMGSAVVLATQPSRNWSNLGMEAVLLPMVQRLLDRGTDRFSHIRSQDCPAVSTVLESLSDTRSRSRPGFSAGVYRDGDALTVLSRPVGEDDPVTLQSGELGELAKGVSWHTLRAKRLDGQAAGEPWPAFVAAALLCLFVERLLTVGVPFTRGGSVQ